MKQDSDRLDDDIQNLIGEKITSENLEAVFKLENRFDYRTPAIYVVDGDPRIRKFIGHNRHVQYLSHVISKDKKGDLEYRLSLAQEYLDRYARAKLVITSNMYCALACVAYSTPVIYIPYKVNIKIPERFLEYVNNTSIEEVENKTYLLQLSDPRANPENPFSHNNITNPKVLEYTPKKDVSIICAAKDRSGNLKRALESWLQHEEVREIVIVDFDSKNKLATVLSDYLKDTRIKIIEAKNQPRWILSKAYNLAAQFATSEKILKVDADILVKPGFFAQHDLINKIFFEGTWFTARDGNEVSLTGTTFFNKKDFNSVGGYNEFIISYGYDDVDLYNRLSKNNVSKNFNFDLLYHIPHDNNVRMMNQPEVKNLAKEGVKNYSIAKRFIWNKRKYRTTYSIERISDTYYIVLENKLKSSIIRTYRSIYCYFRFYTVFNLENMYRVIGEAGIYLNKKTPKLYKFLLRIKYKLVS